MSLHESGLMAASGCSRDGAGGGEKRAGRERKGYILNNLETVALRNQSEMGGQLRLREETLALPGQLVSPRAAAHRHGYGLRAQLQTSGPEGTEGPGSARAKESQAGERERGEPALRPSTLEELEKRKSCPGRSLLRLSSMDIPPELCGGGDTGSQPPSSSSCPLLSPSVSFCKLPGQLEGEGELDRPAFPVPVGSDSQLKLKGIRVRSKSVGPFPDRSRPGKTTSHQAKTSKTAGATTSAGPVE
ncbi:unnamed protein product [Gadus morhua 'NCC']